MKQTLIIAVLLVAIASRCKDKPNAFPKKAIAVVPLRHSVWKDDSGRYWYRAPWIGKIDSTIRITDREFAYLLNTRVAEKWYFISGNSITNDSILAVQMRKFSNKNVTSPIVDPNQDIYADTLGKFISLDSLDIESISPPFNKWYNHNIQPIDSLHLKTNINHE